MSSNFNEKLKKSFRGGSEAKAATAAISSRIKAAVRIGLFALPVLWFIGFVSESKQNDLADSIVKKGNMVGDQGNPQNEQQGSGGQQNVVQKEAVWKTRANTNDPIPVGIWSEWEYIGLKCYFSTFLNKDTRIKWLDYYGKEHELNAGDNPLHVRALSFMSLTENMQTYPYLIECR